MDRKYTAAADVSGVPGAMTAYTVERYSTDILLRYHAKFIGRPNGVVFDSPRHVMGKERISRLLELWKRGVLCFVPITDPAELDVARKNPLLVTPALLHRGIPLKHHHIKTLPGRTEVGRDGENEADALPLVWPKLGL